MATAIPHIKPTPEVTKRAQLVALLKRKEGANLDDMVAATGWLPQLTWAPLNGLRKSGTESNNRSLPRVERGECYLDVVEFSAIARIIGLSADEVIAAVAQKAQSAQNIASNGERFRSGCYRTVKAIVSP